MAEPARSSLSTSRSHLEAEKDDLERQVAERNDWLWQHPEAGPRLDRLELEFRGLDLSGQFVNAVEVGLAAGLEWELPMPAGASTSGWSCSDRNSYNERCPSASATPAPELRFYS